MGRKKFSINGVQITPGTKTTVMLPLPKIHDWTVMQCPVHVIHGSKPGPVLCVTAAIHGDEVNGVEIIRRLMKKKILKELRGTVVAIPIMNLYGFLQHSRYLIDRRDLNRVFPGSEKGSLASRLAQVIVKEVITKADYIIDLHTGAFHRTNLPQLRANTDNPVVKRLAKAFNVPIIINAKDRDGSLRQYANDKDIPILVYEAGEALRFSEIGIKHGLNGIINVMKYLKMLPKPKITHKTIKPAFAESTYWVRAKEGGLLLPRKSLGKRVRTGETLAIIASPTSHHEFKLTSPMEGIIIGMSYLPLIHEGAALFHIAALESLQLTEKHIEYIVETTIGDESSAL